MADIDGPNTTAGGSYPEGDTFMYGQVQSVRPFKNFDPPDPDGRGFEQAPSGAFATGFITVWPDGMVTTPSFNEDDNGPGMYDDTTNYPVVQGNSSYGGDDGNMGVNE